ncbi:MAG: type III PLP-dependent enzyme [Rhodospirillales bacterium]|jgi:ornithine decarboxylase|nr:type III PLP-dependent enzyme [Rhodospirillales bacterium]MBT4041076.1 type III PLP-dependent enzyme [Rhodospirillales bacterium]MBT4628399.1 type III PLP-dependent enzyme [Rhodospirillales bacterium]MBT5350816.1 type III PLP-dependent enzyme [Rhodospirillales bacterium]MBT5522135.1 type III PLP-dependent enzyme [Rhodospirillales bacterium]
MLQQFPTTGHMIAALRPEVSTYCICRPALENQAQAFLGGFPGHVLFAIKANPMNEVVDALYEGGIRHFDTASIGEIASVYDRYDGVIPYFMHPVKGWQATHDAYHQYGVRHFVIDHLDELGKMHDILGDVDEPPVLVIRLSTPSKDAKFNLSEKFGVGLDEAVTLLREATVRGFPVGLCFHVGSQCETTDGYELAFDLTARVLAASNAPIKCLDVGGGFPAPYEGTNPPPLSDFMAVISKRVKALDLPSDCQLMCEPGRALVATGMSMVAQVQLRRDNVLYLNDGVYGTMGGARLGLHFPTRTYNKDGEVSTNDLGPFKIFGPTCDSLDVLPYEIDLPSSIAMGDWIEFGLMGAYGPAVRTEFNGFKPEHFCYVDEPFT